MTFFEDHMSQNPVLPEENTEEIKTVKPRRTKKTTTAEGDAPAAEKKTVRRSRKSAEETAQGEEAEAKKPRRHTTRKTTAPASEAQPLEDDAQAPAKTARKSRVRKTATPKAEESAPAEEIIHLGSALVLDDMLPPVSVTPDAADNAPKKKRRVRKTIEKTPSADAEKQVETEAPQAAGTPAPEEKKRRSRRSASRKRADETRGSSPAEEIIHLGSALVLDDMLPPVSVMPEEDLSLADSAPEAHQDAGKKSRPHRSVKEHAENARPSAPQDAPTPDDDNIGNRVDAPAESEDKKDETVWFDDGVVTNILPYPGEFPEDGRPHARSRRNRKNRDAQPAFNGSPYLPGSYQQGFYDQTQALATDAPFGNRKNRKNRNARRNQQPVPVIPDDFDFNAAMLNDSVLGVALGRREEDFIPEDDGPQPALPDQPVALPLSSGEMAEEDLAALDAAVNGNRIDMPSPSAQKEGRQNRKNKKLPKEERPAPAKSEKKAEVEEVAHPRRVLYVSVVPDEQVEVVITEDGQVTEYFVEMAHQVKIRGNIYKGVINNIDTNLQAAFVNFGNGKNGFLQIDEVHPEYYLVPHDAVHGPKYPPIQKVLKVGQEVLVQVVKEPSGSKGAFLTTWISIAGRFLVLTPGQEQIGVSRKVEDPEERNASRIC